MTSVPSSAQGSTELTEDALARSAETRRRLKVQVTDLVCTMVVLAACASTWAMRLVGPLDLRYDAATYYVLGTSLAEGKGYRLLNEPGEIAAIQYPPLLPLIVAAHQRVLGTSDPVHAGAALRWTFMAMSCLLSVGTFFTARRFLHSLPSLLAALITTYYFNTYFLSEVFFAEIPFTLVTLTFFLLSIRGSKVARTASGVAAVAAFALRTAGVALLAAWVGDSLIRRRYVEAAIRAAIAVLAVGLWQGYVSHVRNAPDYQRPAYSYQRAAYQFYNVSYAENVALRDPFEPEGGRVTAREFAGRAWKNSYRLPLNLGESVTANQGSIEWTLHLVNRWVSREVVPPWTVSSIGLNILGLLILAGAVLLALRREYLIPLYLVASVALMSITPWPMQFTRYAAPLSPFLAICLLQTLVRMAGGASLRLGLAGWLRNAAVVLVLGFLLGVQAVTVYKVFWYDLGWNVYRNRNGDRSLARHFYFNHRWREFMEALYWVERHSAPGDVVSTMSPQLAHIYINRKAVMPPFEVDQDKAQALLDEVPVKYVIIDDLGFVGVTRKYTRPMILNRRELWELVYDVPDHGLEVYRRRR